MWPSSCSKRCWPTRGGCMRGSSSGASSARPTAGGPGGCAAGRVSQLDSHPGWAASTTRPVLRALVTSTLLDAVAHAAQHFAEWWAAGVTLWADRRPGNPWRDRGRVGRSADAAAGRGAMASSRAPTMALPRRPTMGRVEREPAPGLGEGESQGRGCTSRAPSRCGTTSPRRRPRGSVRSSPPRRITSGGAGQGGRPAPTARTRGRGGTPAHSAT